MRKNGKQITININTFIRLRSTKVNFRCNDDVMIIISIINRIFVMIHNYIRNSLGVNFYDESSFSALCWVILEVRYFYFHLVNIGLLVMVCIFYYKNASSSIPIVFLRKSYLRFVRMRGNLGTSWST